MSAVIPEVIEHPLDAKALSQRSREILGDPHLADFVGKIDLDCWGRIILRLVNTDRGAIAANLAVLFSAQLDGRTLVEVVVRTPSAVCAPDVACPEEFLKVRRNETPLQTAPEICVEIASPSNAIHDLRAKARAYLELTYSPAGTSVRSAIALQCGLLSRTSKRLRI